MWAYLVARESFAYTLCECECVWVCVCVGVALCGAHGWRIRRRVLFSFTTVVEVVSRGCESTTTSSGGTRLRKSRSTRTCERLLDAIQNRIHVWDQITQSTTATVIIAHYADMMLDPDLWGRGGGCMSSWGFSSLPRCVLLPLRRAWMSTSSTLPNKHSLSHPLDMCVINERYNKTNKPSPTTLFC